MYSTLLVLSTSEKSQEKKTGSWFKEKVKALDVIKVKEMKIEVDEAIDQDSLLKGRVLMPKTSYCNLICRRMSNNMINISQIYWSNRKKLVKEIAALDNYSARYSKTTEDYNFDYCKTCFGPTIGHKDIDCTDIDWTDKDINDIKDIIKDSAVFKTKFEFMKRNEDLFKKREPSARNNTRVVPRLRQSFPPKQRQWIIAPMKKGLPAKAETMDCRSNKQLAN